MSATEPIFHSVSHRNNMNVVRYYLSFCVLLAHFSSLTGNYIPWLQRGTVDVGCFFAISGFLMFLSFQKRPTLRGYLKRRARRILPPYVPPSDSSSSRRSPPPVTSPTADYGNISPPT